MRNLHEQAKPQDAGLSFRWSKCPKTLRCQRIGGRGRSRGWAIMALGLPIVLNVKHDRFTQCVWTVARRTFSPQLFVSALASKKEGTTKSGGVPIKSVWPHLNSASLCLGARCFRGMAPQELEFALFEHTCYTSPRHCEYKMSSGPLRDVGECEDEPLLGLWVPLPGFALCTWLGLRWLGLHFTSA